MPPRSHRTPAPLDDFIEEEYVYDESEGSEEEESEEEGSGTEEDDGEEQDEEEEEEAEEDGADEEEEAEVRESVGEGCGPSVRARVPGVAAAAERPSGMPTCPVCMEAWTTEGEHRISCIPCGHVYARSCLEKWLTQRGNTSAPCPQCAKRFKLKDIINLYAPEVAVPNIELEKHALYLREKVDSLEKLAVKHDRLLEEIVAQKRRILSDQMSTDVGVSKRQKIAERSDGLTYVEPSTSATGDHISSNSSRFVLENELVLDGARIMGIDASNQMVLAAGKAPGLGGEHVLTKISMMSSHETRKIHFPPNTKAVRDICFLSDGSAIFASLGKKLSLLSMTTESVVLQCDLPAPGWSCSADRSSSHHVYAGLQNAMLLVFDLRQTARPLHSMEGLSANPVHTVHSVVEDSGSRKVISASSKGPCMWDADGGQSRPHLLIRANDQRVCISLACTPPSSDLLVATFRPKVDSSGDAAASQVYLSQTSTSSGFGKLGQHTLIRRTGTTTFAQERTYHGNVSELLMSKSAILPCGNNQHLFAYGDESLHGVRTWKLPSFGLHTDLSSHRQPILDLRYAESPVGGRYLGCLSEDKLQVFSVR